MASQERLIRMRASVVTLKTLGEEMDGIRKAFVLALTGGDHFVEKAVTESLKWYGLTGCKITLFMSLELAFHTRTPKVASRVFDAMVEDWDSFGSIFYKVLQMDDNPFWDGIEAFQWYLKVASNQFYQNLNLLDVPYLGFTFAAHAAATARATVLLMLLRNGADPYKATLLLDPSLKSLAGWAMVLRLILRALPYPSSNILKIEPGLVLVPRLKHLCKVVIRNELKSTRSLPEGIYDLDIPFELKEYLDLLRDP